MNAEDLHATMREQRARIEQITAQVYSITAYKAETARRARRRKMAIACWTSSAVSLLIVLLVCFLLR